MEKKLIDFTKVEIETIDGKKTPTDVSKAVGNCIYSQTPDIGMMELARTVYFKGEAEMSMNEIRYFREVLVNTNTLIAPLKVALKEMFQAAEAQE